MPWPIRSTRLAAYNATPAANTEVTLGTVPSGKRWLVKDWAVYNAGASVRAVFMMLRSGGVTYIYDASPTIASGTTVGNPNRHVVLNAGDELRFQTTTAQAIHVTIHGAQLG